MVASVDDVKKILEREGISAESFFERIVRMEQLLKDLTEVNDYEFPYRIPDLISRAHTIISKSHR